MFKCLDLPVFCVEYRSYSVPWLYGLRMHVHPEGETIAVVSANCQFCPASAPLRFLRTLVLPPQPKGDTVQLTLALRSVTV